jgi:hypothetical protein
MLLAGQRQAAYHLHFANGTVIGGPLLVPFTFNDAGLVTLMEEFVNEAQWPTNYKDKAKPEIVGGG